MSYELKKKQVIEKNSLVVSVPYCGLQSLFRYKSPIGHTCGVYGWNADIYQFGGTAIVTGYRPFGSNEFRDITKKYEELAQKIEDYRVADAEKILDGLCKKMISAIWERMREEDERI